MTSSVAHVRVLVLLAVAVLVAALSAAIATAPRADAAAPTSSAHPFSDPIWFPLRVKVNLDCVKDNPGCTTPHKNWMMDVVPDDGQFDRGGHPSQAKVYAMGAGILHIGEAAGPKCGTENSYGTWVWIDHGGGRLSRYGHLGRIVGREGAYVAAGQQIGVVGSTGKIHNCHINYLDFMVQYDGLDTDHGVEFRTLRACNAGTGRAESWPSAVYPRYSRWNSVPQGSKFPASSGACLPASAPRTANRPTRTSVTRTGSGTLVVKWARPAAASRVNAVRVQVSLYHPSTRKWDAASHDRYPTVAGSRSSMTVSKLGPKRLYRVRVTFHNAVGFSAHSAWLTRTA